MASHRNQFSFLQSDRCWLCLLHDDRRGGVNNHGNTDNKCSVNSTHITGLKIKV